MKLTDRSACPDSQPRAAGNSGMGNPGRLTGAGQRGVVHSGRPAAQCLVLWAARDARFREPLARDPQKPCGGLRARQRLGPEPGSPGSLTTVDPAASREGLAATRSGGETEPEQRREPHAIRTGRGIGDESIFPPPRLPAVTPPIPPDRHRDGLLFGFVSIQGFPLAYDFWCELLITLMNSETLDGANNAVQEHLEWRASDPDLGVEPVSLTWRETRSVRDVLSKHLFVKDDQVVVPNLNLKAAKLIICRNEKQKQALRRMGFIEDRLVIRGWRPRQ
jgi:hypothetical protein